MRSLVFVPLIAALLLIGIILIINDPGVGRFRNYGVIFFSEFIVVVNLGIFAVGRFTRTELLLRLVKYSFAVSIVCMLLLAGTCGPDLTVRTIFTQMAPWQDSKVSNHQ